MLVEGEVGAYPQTVQTVVQVGTPHQSGLVQSQAVTLCDQEEVLETAVSMYIETLETVSAKTKTLRSTDFLVLTHQLVFQLVSTTRLAAFRVELEDQQTIIVPAIDKIGEAQRVVRTTALAAHTDI